MHPPVLFLHAGVADSRMWAKEVALLTATGTRATAYDRPGFGTTPPATAPFRHIDQVLQQLELLGGEPAILVGCSQGGRISIDTALAQPARVRALVLVAPAVNGAPVADKYPPPVQALLEQHKAADAAQDKARMNALEAWCWLDGPASAEGRVGGAARELFLDMNRIVLANAGPDLSEPMPDAWSRLEQIAGPTLVLHGDLDFPHLQERCRAMVTRMPDARGEVLEGTAHLPNLEVPERFAAALNGFLRGL